MSLRKTVLAAFAALCLIPLASPLPAPRRLKRQIKGVPVGPQIDNSDIPYNPVGPVGLSGDPYGGRNLLGAAGDGAPAAGDNPAHANAEELVGPYKLVPGQDDDADLGLYLDLSNSANPQGLRGENDGTDPGPQNEAIQRQNSDVFARPASDSGDVRCPNGRFTGNISENC